MDVPSLYKELLEANSNNEWKNPVLLETSAEFKDEFFNVRVDSFLELVGSNNVRIYRVRQRWGEIMIFCRRVTY